MNRNYYSYNKSNNSFIKQNKNLDYKYVNPYFDEYPTKILPPKKTTYSLYKANIFWIGITIFNYITNWFIGLKLDDFVVEDKYRSDYDLYDIIFTLIDKNYFLSNIILYFCFCQIIIVGFEIFFDIEKKTVHNLANILGIIYLSSILWTNSLVWLWNFDPIYKENYLTFKETTDFVDPVRLILNYYLIGEALVLILILIPCILLLTYFIINFFKNNIGKIIIKKSN